VANRRPSTRPTPLPPTWPPGSPASTASCSQGGGDLAPHRYGAADTHDSVYDVDDLQDAFDIDAARRTLDLGLPLLAICRGLQVVNVALGGSLEQDMGGPEREHRHLVHPVSVRGGSLLEQATGVACYLHQRVDRLGAGLGVTARAADCTVEALELPGANGWFTAVQWHPEDTAHKDPAQQGLFDALVRAARDSR
jgi:putative glutamine amidotransferase